MNRPLTLYDAVACAFSFFVPGAGQVCKLHILRGVCFFFGSLVLWLMLLGWLIHLWACIDALFLNPRRHDGTKIVALLLALLFVSSTAEAGRFFRYRYRSRSAPACRGPNCKPPQAKLPPAGVIPETAPIVPPPVERPFDTDPY